MFYFPVSLEQLSHHLLYEDGVCGYILDTLDNTYLGSNVWNDIADAKETNIREFYQEAYFVCGAETTASIGDLVFYAAGGHMMAVPVIMSRFWLVKEDNTMEERTIDEVLGLLTIK